MADSDAQEELYVGDLCRKCLHRHRNRSAVCGVRIWAICRCGGNGTEGQDEYTAARAEGYAECTRDVVAYLRDGDGAFAHDPQECAEDVERGRHIGASKKEGR